MSNLVENNNSFVKYNQVWANFTFTDNIPEVAPSLNSATSTNTYTNKDKSIYTVYIYQKKTDNETYDYLMYISNFQLTKEFRQRKDWKFELNGNEETIRSIILPGTTTSRSYTPSFSNGEYEIPFTSVDPYFDLRDCRIKVGLDFDKLYFSGWIYLGKTLKDLLGDNLIPPFDSIKWLIKDTKTGNKVKFDISSERTYKLPSDTFTGKEGDNTIITTNILNQALNSFGILDEGVYW